MGDDGAEEGQSLIIHSFDPFHPNNNQKGYTGQHKTDIRTTGYFGSEKFP